MIADLRVTPDAAASRRALEAIGAADQIILGPGSLFTSIIAPLKVGGMAEAVSASEATLVYVSNLTTQDGETLGMSGIEHVEALVGIGGIRTPDVAVAHEGPLDVPDGLEGIGFEPDQMSEAGIRLEVGDMAVVGADWPGHDAARLGALLRRLGPVD